MAQTSTTCTLRDALDNVCILDELITADDQPCIEAGHVGIYYHADKDTNFEDVQAFVTGVAKYNEEALTHARLNTYLEEGEKYAILLYTWRCCTRAFPSIKSNEQENRRQIYETEIEVLNPQVSRLLDLMHFTEKAISSFCDEVMRLTGKNQDFVSEAYLLTIGKMMNMFMVLDELKNMKASVKNDFSAWKRAAQYLKKFDNDQFTDHLNFSMYLATQNKIRDELKTKLANMHWTAVDQYQEFLCDVINASANMYEERYYLLPAEKHMLIKVIAFGLYMIDSPAYNINKVKKLNLSRLDKILKDVEVVQLYGDMQVNPFSYIRQTHNFDPSNWPLCSKAGATSPQAAFLANLPEIREQHNSYLCELSRLSNKIIIGGGAQRLDDERVIDRDSEVQYKLALRGLHLLANWTLQISELYSWKLLNARDEGDLPKDCKDKDYDYARSIKYNLNTEEKSALVEVIAMIKSVQVLLSKLETVLMDGIRHHIYLSLQQFVQNTLAEPLKKMKKGKKQLQMSVLMAIRETCVEWPDPSLGPRDMPPTQKSGKQRGQPADMPPILRRKVGPSSTQLYMVRTMIESLISDKQSGKKTLRKDLDPQNIENILDFHKKTFFWPYLLNFVDTLGKCCDLSQLWFREFFLEVSKHIQYPIDMSLPWILTDHVLEKGDPSLMEYLLYPMDLYNDSAHCALQRFRKQFLYEEIEAEVNLCFDQLVYKLSGQIFAYYKRLAGVTMLDKSFKRKCVEQRAAGNVGLDLSYPPVCRYESLMRQRHVQILGRTIDLRELLSQRIMGSVRRSLETAVQQFECSPLSSIVELEAMIDLNRCCHRMLSKHLALGNFDFILQEVCQTVSAPYGRICLQAFIELENDFLPNYCYSIASNKFTVRPYAREFKREKPPQNLFPEFTCGSHDLDRAFKTVYAPYQQFIGPRHFQSLVIVLGYQGISCLIGELLDKLRRSLEEDLSKNIQILKRALPETLRMPRLSYQDYGVCEFFRAQLKELLDGREQRYDIFQLFRELGNGLLFIWQLEQNLTVSEVRDLVMSGPFQLNFPRPLAQPKPGQNRPSKDDEDREVHRLRARYGPAFDVQKMLKRFGSEQQHALLEECELLTIERLCCGLTIFKVVLQRLRTSLVSHTEIWSTSSQEPDVVFFSNGEFHRVWSALQFMFCIPPASENDLPVEELFGDGLNFAGCTLIALLGQQHRFEAMDFCYYLDRAMKINHKKDDLNGPTSSAVSVQKMCNRIRRFMVINRQIFAFLRKMMLPSPGQEEEDNATQQVPFVPPSPLNPRVSRPAPAGSSAGPAVSAAFYNSNGPAANLAHPTMQYT